jgi:hypothetical protein
MGWGRSVKLVLSRDLSLQNISFKARQGQHLVDWSVIRLQTNNIENLYDKLKEKHPQAKRQLMPWGLKEVCVVDPSESLLGVLSKRN